MSRYAMNLNDGRRVFNSEAVRNNINYVEIDDETHAAIQRGDLAWQVVANAVRAKRNNDPMFDWQKYDQLRERMNVRKANFQLKSSENSDVTGAEAEKKDDGGINPTVSFVELNKPEVRHASTEDNTNIGVMDGQDNFSPISGTAEAVAGKKGRSK